MRTLALPRISRPLLHAFLIYACMQHTQKQQPQQQQQQQQQQASKQASKRALHQSPLSYARIHKHTTLSSFTSTSGVAVFIGSRVASNKQQHFTSFAALLLLLLMTPICAYDLGALSLRSCFEFSLSRSLARFYTHTYIYHSSWRI